MITWDEAKRRSNLAKHGVDLALAEQFDWESAIFEEDDSEAYGEQREIATGWIGEGLYGMTEIMPSAYEKRSREKRGATQANSDPLTEAELAEVYRARAEAARRPSNMLIPSRMRRTRA